jgi:type II secretory pathway component PulF
MEFIYTAKTQSGDIVQGRVEATKESLAVDALHARGYVVLSLDLIKKDFFSSDINKFFSRPKTRDIVVFTRQLATLIEADVPLSDGLKTLIDQTDKASFKEVLQNMSQAIESGSPLSEAFAAHPKLFTPFFIQLVKSGEVSGKLQESLLYLADYAERSQALLSKVKGALAYPAFIVFAMILVSIIMAVYVLPNLLAIFEEFEVTELPLTTRILIFTIDFINKYLWYLAVGSVGGIYALTRFLKTPGGKEWKDNLVINLPYLGKIFRNFYLARMGESLSTLIKSGIPILEAINISSDIVGNENYRRILLRSEESLRNGKTISSVLREYKEIPLLFSSMLATGEKSGKTASMLDHITKFYKDEAENTIAGISQLIEPVIMLILGLAVGVLVSSILLPMYSLSSSL